MKPSDYTKIIQNILHVEFEKSCLMADDKCACSMTDVSPCSIENGCIDVLSNIECSPEFCPAKRYCRNQNIQRGPQFASQIRKTQSKGWGLFAMEEIPARRYIIEYMGEIIDNVEFENRFTVNEDKNFYFFALNSKMYIDATFYGNESRFVNSCEPNAIAEKWIVHSNGQKQIRIGLFTLQKIRTVSYI